MLSNSLSVHIFANAHTYIYSFSHITHFTHTCQHAARAPDGRLRLSSHHRRPRIPWPACGRPPAAPAWPLCPTTQPKSAQPALTRSQRHARWGILPPCAAPSTCTQLASALLLSTKATRPAEYTQKPNSRPRTRSWVSLTQPPRPQNCLRGDCQPPFLQRHTSSCWSTPYLQPTRTANDLSDGGLFMYHYNRKLAGQGGLTSPRAVQSGHPARTKSHARTTLPQK